MAYKGSSAKRISGHGVTHGKPKPTINRPAPSSGQYNKSADPQADLSVAQREHSTIMPKSDMSHNDLSK